jgi:hypothetical protein
MGLFRSVCLGIWIDFDLGFCDWVLCLGFKLWVGVCIWIAGLGLGGVCVWGLSLGLGPGLGVVSGAWGFPVLELKGVKPQNRVWALFWGLGWLGL